jgi:DNA polymerase
MLGSSFRLLRERGSWRALDGGRWALATVHPACVLRSGADFVQTCATLVTDLRKLRRRPD